jgi:biopolymer transport protein ExbD
MITISCNNDFIVEMTIKCVSFEKLFMAEFNRTWGQNPGAGVSRMKRHNLKTDMTPMVDLGFLLITFFVFTAELSKPRITNLYMPHDGITMPTPRSRSITILTGSNDKLFYYYGTEEDVAKDKAVYLTSYDEKNGAGKIIREKQLQLEQSGIGKKELVVLIKPDAESSYKNVVEMLDEMMINGVTRYTVVRPGSWEAQYLSSNK